MGNHRRHVAEVESPYFIFGGAAGLLVTLAVFAVAVFVLRTRYADEFVREADVERVTG